MRSYIKKKSESVEADTCFYNAREFVLSFLSGYKKLLFAVVFFVLILPVAFVMFANNELKNVSLGEESLIQLSQTSISSVSANKSVISIPAGIVKANPFLPYRDLGETIPTSDVPAFNLVEPPEVVNGNSDAARVMDTIVSGILYDKYSPSAILNIEGNDYLVKKGDVVNNYKVMNIAQDSVTVKLGNNVYKAGIGEILTEGSLNHNEVSNLNNKFGGIQ